MRKSLVFAALAIGLLAAGCGEKPTATVYKNGEYSGKPDTQPWSGAQFKGDRQAWERAIKARNSNQNEYSRAVAN